MTGLSTGRRAEQPAGPCDALSREIQELCGELDNSLKFTQLPPKQTPETGQPDACSACAQMSEEVCEWVSLVVRVSDAGCV